MNDTVSSVPTAAPAPSSSPAPSHEQSPPEHLAALAEGEDVSEYAEQVREDRGETGEDLTPAQRTLNRHQRHRQKIERQAAEIAALKAERDGPRAADGEPEDVRKMLHPDEAAQAGGENQQQPAATDPQLQQQPGETAEQFAERIAQEIERTALENAREQHEHEQRKRNFETRKATRAAQIIPNYEQSLKTAPYASVPIHPEIEKIIMDADYGDIHQHALAHNRELIEQLLSQPTLRHVQRFVDKLDLFAENALGGRQTPQPQPQPRRIPATTRAAPPIAPLRGSGGPTPSLSRLAESDNVEAYARARSQQRR